MVNCLFCQGILLVVDSIFPVDDHKFTAYTGSRDTSKARKICNAVLQLIFALVPTFIPTELLPP